MPVHGDPSGEVQEVKLGRIDNAKDNPQVFYGLHFAPGVAEYQGPEGEPFRIFINEDTAKQMDPTYEGKPVYVRHVDKVDLANLQNEADGYVAESFYNEADGKHWVKFIVVSDAGKEAIRKGWRLSNSYQPKHMGPGGHWHGVEFKNEITAGEYDHLAIVENPRYDESVILTPEQFKKYNNEKKIELVALKNEAEKPQGGSMNWFKREKVKNAEDFLTMSVELPKSKREVAISKLINEADEAIMAEGKPMNADPSHMVTLHDGSTCNVGELIAKHKALTDELATLKNPPAEEVPGEEVNPDAKPKVEDAVTPEADKAAKEDLLRLAEHEEEEIEQAKMKNAAKVTALRNELGLAPKGKKETEKSPEELEKIRNAKEKADRLRNAHIVAAAPKVVETSMDKVERGRAKYGS